jgi:hypothetical protein
MAETISLSSTIALTRSLAADNPLLVTGSATIEAPGGIALNLEAPVVWTLTNYGVIGVSGATGEALRLGAGGTITNMASGSIVGAAYGAAIAGGAGSVTNAGLVQAQGSLGVALDLVGGGDVGNNGGATITGGRGVEIAGAGGTLTNAGRISGYTTGVYLTGGTIANTGVIISPNNDGIQLNGAGFVTNAASATIAGGFGIIDTVHAAIIDNNGLISGSTFDGIGIFGEGGGTVSNASGGAIYGNLYGVDIETGTPTVINAGLITTARSAAITTDFGGPGIAYVGNTGSIIGGAGIKIDRSVGSVHNTGLINGSDNFGVWLESGGNVTNAAGATIRGGVGVNIGGGGVSGAGGGTLINAGTIAVNGTLPSYAVYLQHGYANRLIADNGAVFVGELDGGNAVGTPPDSVLELATGSGTVGDFTNFGSIAFDTGAAWKISSSIQALAEGEVISGFTTGDTIEITGVNDTGGTFAGGQLTLSGPLPLTLSLPGTFSVPFAVTPSGANTEITLACFAAGARILTDAGEVAVENLRPGARIVSFTHRQPGVVKWVGQQHSRVPPVRIAAGAFGAGLPHRALHLSPDHALFIDGALIPVRHLVNGTTIAELAGDCTTYCHVELESHAVLLAEGLPAESYLDTGNRAAFDTVRKLTPAYPASQAARAIQAGIAGCRER